jgi:hypothetical protein
MEVGRGTDKYICAGTVASSKGISLASKSAGHAGQNQKVARKPVDKPVE